MDGAIRKALLSSAVAALAAIGPGCTGSVGTTAASMLRKVRESPDPNVRYLAYAKLGSERAYDTEEQKDEATRELSRAFLAGKEPVASRAAICRTLGELGRPEAREAVLAAVNDRDEPAIRAAGCRALGRVGKPEDWTALARIMAADSDLDCRVAAVEGLAKMHIEDPRLDLMLVDGMEDPEPAIRLASLRALRSVRGKDLGVEPGPWKLAAEERMKAAKR